MIESRSSRRSLLLLSCAALCFLLACSGSKSDVKHAQVKPGNMPEVGEWTGVYYSTLYGHLHLVKEGDTISGKWRTTSGDKWGEMNGKVTGDLFRYEWREQTIGVVGPSANTSGHGYFKYVVPAGNAEHEIRGEWGLGQSNAGQKWTAIKQRNVKPDPDSVMPDETQTHTGVDNSWDQAPGSKKKAPKKDDSSDDEEEESTDDWE